MKHAAILLTLVAVMAFAPSAFAGCAKCNTTDGCFGATQGWVDCYFDGECHRIGGFCNGFTGEATPLAATYTVAAVHVVETETVKAPQLDTKTLSAPQEAEKVVAGR
ncbi:MAG: hypothetical protein ABI779_11865 [Acidobacteriota bacterium]